jgi:hypothetical protein
MIIGLSGYARSGKDTIAEILIMNYGFRRLAFADNIRKAVKTLDPILDNGKRVSEMVSQIGWEGTKNYPEMRRMLQVFGTEVGRDMFGENFWVEQVFREIDSDDIIENFVITDVRYPNEADSIRDRGGEIWRITRSQVDAINSHISEKALDDYSFDRNVSNNDSIADLSTEIFTIIRGMHAKI